MIPICVIGLGYIGLPTCLLLSEHNDLVFGYDVNRSLVQALRKQEISYDENSVVAKFHQLVREERLPQFEVVVPRASIYIICVPTPLENDLKVTKSFPRADLRHVNAALDGIVEHLTETSLVVLESTSPVGTTEYVYEYIEKKTGLNCDVAYCPERMIPGDAIHELIGNDRMIGCLTSGSGDRAKKLYSCLVRGKLFVTDASTAEFTKLAENTYRDVNIALANQFARLAQLKSVDISKVISSANRHPRVNIHQPGIGVGGHCIPIDPWFLLDGCLGDSTEGDQKDGGLIALARKMNDSQTEFVSDWINQQISSLFDKRSPDLCFIGSSYKAGSADMRESPAVKVIALVKSRNKNLHFHVCDPVVPEFRNLWDRIVARSDLFSVYVILVKHPGVEDWITNNICKNKFRYISLGGRQLNLDLNSRPVIIDCSFT